ncbi:flagellin N-terminal helical domain-containing protein [Clostridium lacusfryxellense]|uniref:flagellin N-terminal helical domain-containing protein n=1 Tax=Clostridium lacusfryxellense TaxID=205328 RepID=UPI001C0BAE87|nr:flagellin [Clostridium lacusfryxellense]MBU3111768.1 flagellin [Clostridium lacusfryxellense]
MIINHNLGGMNATRNMGINASNASKSMEKLSSGLRINKAGDDAAGLAISEKMRGQIRGLDQASANAQDGISMIGTGEGALNETTAILQRMRELAVQGSNDTNTTEDRTQIQKEMNQLTSETSRIGNTTQFNTQNLLDGSAGVKTAAGTNAGTAAAQVTTGGLTFDFSASSALNGYTIKTGVVAASTVTSATIDTTNKVITLNGDFSGTPNVTTANAATAINGALTGASIAATVTVGGAAVTTATNISSAVLSGGINSTPRAASSAFTFQIGANQSQTFTASFTDMRSSALGLAGTAGGAATGTSNDVVGAKYVATGTANDLSDVSTTGEHALDLSSSASSSAAIKVLDQATATVSGERAKLGAYSNRLDHTIANLGTSSENLTSAESRIRDVDMAKEMSTFSKNNILNQAAQAMLVQANQQPQQVLALLR